MNPGPLCIQSSFSGFSLLSSNKETMWQLLLCMHQHRTSLSEEAKGWERFRLVTFLFLLLEGFTFLNFELTVTVLFNLVHQVKHPFGSTYGLEFCCTV